MIAISLGCGRNPYLLYKIMRLFMFFKCIRSSIATLSASRTAVLVKRS